MIRSGSVSAVSSAGTLSVQLDALVGCGSCAAAGGCGIQLLPSANKSVQIECPYPPNTQIDIGQRVQVSIPEPTHGWLLLVVRAYGWPTLGMLGGAALGFWAASVLNLPSYQELFSVAGFALGLSGGLLAWDKNNKSGYSAQWRDCTGELMLPVLDETAEQQYP